MVRTLAPYEWWQITKVPWSYCRFSIGCGYYTLIKMVGNRQQSEPGAARRIGQQKSHIKAHPRCYVQKCLCHTIKAYVPRSTRERSKRSWFLTLGTILLKCQIPLSLRVNWIRPKMEAEHIRLVTGNKGSRSLSKFCVRSMWSSHPVYLL